MENVFNKYSAHNILITLLRCTELIESIGGIANKFHEKGIYIIKLRIMLNITKICLYDFDPLKPHFYIVKLGFTGVYIIFLISAQKYRLRVFVRTAS